ncbi:MAG: hypothetical protein AAGI52_06245 [Bacteroidota bacterium]
MTEDEFRQAFALSPLKGVATIGISLLFPSLIVRVPDALDLEVWHDLGAGDIALVIALVVLSIAAFFRNVRWWMLAGGFGIAGVLWVVLNLR